MLRCGSAGRPLISASESFRQKKVDRFLGVGPVFTNVQCHLSDKAVRTKPQAPRPLQ